VNRVRMPIVHFIFILFVAAATLSPVGADAGDPRQRAVAALEQDLKTDPNNSELWLHLGFAYRKLDQVDQAQAAFEKAASLNPRSEDAYYMLGLIYEKKGQKSQALSVWKNYLAAETDPIKRSVAQKHIHQLEP